jgi:hypothetical protein
MMSTSGPLPSGVSFEDAEKIAQGEMVANAALVARFKANKILPLQSEFIGFFVELPEEAWRALRQAMIDAKIPIRDIDNKVKAKRLQGMQAASRDWRRSVCFKVAVDLKAAGATYETSSVSARGP